MHSQIGIPSRALKFQRTAALLQSGGIHSPPGLCGTAHVFHCPSEIRGSEQSYCQQAERTDPCALREPHSMNLRYASQDHTDEEQPKHEFEPRNNPRGNPNTRRCLNECDLAQDSKHGANTGYAKPFYWQVFCSIRILVALVKKEDTATSHQDCRIRKPIETMIKRMRNPSGEVGNVPQMFVFLCRPESIPRR